MLQVGCTDCTENSNKKAYICEDCLNVWFLYLISDRKRYHFYNTDTIFIIKKTEVNRYIQQYLFNKLYYQLVVVLQALVIP